MNSSVPVTPAMKRRGSRASADGPRRGGLRRRVLSSSTVAASAAFVAAIFIPQHSAFAQTFTWNGTTGTWSDGTRWVGGVAPNNGGNNNYILNFTGTAAFTATNDFLTQPFILNAMNLSNTVTGNVITGGTINFQTSPTAVAPTLNQNGAGGFTINSALALGADTTVGGAGAGQITVNGLISGAGGLTKTSVNFLVLNNAASTYTGATTLANGLIRFVGNVGVSANSAFGNAASPIVIGSAATLANNSPVLSFGSSTSGSATVDRALDMSQAPGTVVNQRVSVRIDNTTTGVIPNNGAQTSTFLGSNNNTLTLNGAIAIGTGTPATILRGHQFAAVQSNSRLVVNGLISGTNSGAFLINGSNSGIGTVQFTNAANSFTAAVTVTNGTLLIGSNITSAAGADSLLGRTLNINLSDGATLASNQTLGGGGVGALSNPRVLLDGDLTVNRTFNLSPGATFVNANIIGDGSVNSYTLGTTASNTGAASYTGAITAQGLATNLNLNLTTGTATSVLAFGGGIGAQAQVGAVNVNINQNIVPTTGLPGAPSAGTVQLNGNNSFEGTANVTGGTLVLGNINALGRTSGGTTVATINVPNGLGTGQGLLNTSGTPTLVNYGGANVASGATLDMGGRVIGAEAITLNGGSLINNSATASTLNAVGGVPSIALTDTGTPQTYVAAPTVSITGGGGTGAAAIARLNVANIALGSGGSGYSAATTKVFISIAGGTAVNATDSVQSGFNAVPVISGGVITGVTIRLMGGNMSATPVITFVDSAGTPGTGATATATSFVTGLDVTNSGTGYTSAPTVALSSGDAVVTASNTIVNFAQSSNIGGSGNLSVGGVVAGATGATVTKVGAGTLTLSGVNTYNGPTVVQGGVLNVSGSIAASSGLTIASGGTVAGGGILPGIALQTGGRLDPGPLTVTGTLTATSLTVDGGSTLAFLLGADPTIAGASDLLTLSGAFNKSATSGVFNFDFAGSSAVLSEASPYTLVSFAPGGTNFTAGDVAGFQVSNLPAGYAGVFNLDAASGALQLNVAAVAVPEPGSIALLLTAGLPVAGLLLLRRARKA